VVVSFPDPHEKWKRVWCSERHFLSHGVGPYFVIIAFLDLELKVSDTSMHMDYYTAPCTKARDGCRVYRDMQNSLRDMYSLLRFKIQCLHHTSIIKSSVKSQSEIGPAPCDKKCCSEHQTFFACAEGLGTRLIQR